jgi:hypothetical protein
MFNYLNKLIPLAYRVRLQALHEHRRSYSNSRAHDFWKKNKDFDVS